MSRARRLARDCERLPHVLMGLHFLACVCVMLHQLIHLFSNSLHALGATGFAIHSGRGASMTAMTATGGFNLVFQFREQAVGDILMRVLNASLSTSHLTNERISAPGR
jgi:hypothetical protein